MHQLVHVHTWWMEWGPRPYQWNAFLQKYFWYCFYVEIASIRPTRRIILIFWPAFTFAPSFIVILFSRLGIFWMIDTIWWCLKLCYRLLWLRAFVLFMSFLLFFIPEEIKDDKRNTHKYKYILCLSDRCALILFVLCLQIVLLSQLMDWYLSNVLWDDGWWVGLVGHPRLPM